MGAYKRNVVVVIKMGAYIYGVLILCGCLLSQFYGMNQLTIVVAEFQFRAGSFLKFETSWVFISTPTFRLQYCLVSTLPCDGFSPFVHVEFF